MVRNAKGTLLGHTIGQVGLQETPSWNFIYQTNTVKHPDYNVGDFVDTPDGRRYRYCKAGSGSALVAGNVQQGIVEDTGDQDLTPVAAAIGDTSIITTSTVTVDANQYAGGYASITTSAGVGHIYLISGHSAASAAVVTINLAETIRVALTTSSRVDLVQNPFANILLAAASPTSAPLGVPPIPLTASSFGWLQVAGVACIESQGGATVGLTQVLSDANAGAVEDIADGANELISQVGIALTGVATGEFGAVRINLL